MATRGVSTVITYRAWDTSANSGKTGDVANHTLRWIKDGTSSATTNSPAEVDATNVPGVYKVTLTDTETDCTFGILAGKSSTSNIAIFGAQIGFEYVPTSSTTFGAYIGNSTAAIAVDGSGNVSLTSTYDFAKGTTAMTEAYAVNGAAPTPVQALYAIHQMLMDFAISGTSYTVKKLDNSTTAFTVTLDSATTPTSASRV
jgi:flagellar capping protein FliD